MPIKLRVINIVISLILCWALSGTGAHLGRQSEPMTIKNYVHLEVELCWIEGWVDSENWK